MAYPTQSEITAYIIQAAKARGIDPNVALRVWSSEGRGGNPAEGWQSNIVKNGVREQSFGPYQLYKKGLGANAPFDITDPSNWRQNIDYSLDNVVKGGWGPWYGAKANNITGFTGVAKNAAPQGILQQASTSRAEPQTLVETATQPSKAMTLEDYMNFHMGPQGGQNMGGSVMTAMGIPPEMQMLLGGGQQGGSQLPPSITPGSAQMAQLPPPPQGGVMQQASAPSQQASVDPSSLPPQIQQLLQKNPSLWALLSSGGMA